MIELAAHIPTREVLEKGLDLASLGDAAGFPVLEPAREAFRSLWEERLSVETFSRVYFGTEFCEHLIPVPEALTAIALQARSAGLDLTLVTPYVGEGGLSRIVPLLDELAAGFPGSEVVFNDWGVGRLLSRNYASLAPVMGRLLAKGLRDPRFTDALAMSEALTKDAGDAFRAPGTGGRGMRALLDRLAVRRVEIDILPQGADLAGVDPGLAVSVYAPFGTVSTSRICMSAGLSSEAREKFAPGTPCHHECQGHVSTYRYAHSPFRAAERTFYQKGNSHFFAHRKDEMLSLLEALSRRNGRIVYQPGIPLWS